MWLQRFSSSIYCIEVETFSNNLLYRVLWQMNKLQSEIAKDKDRIT